MPSERALFKCIIRKFHPALGEFESALEHRLMPAQNWALYKAYRCNNGVLEALRVIREPSGKSVSAPVWEMRPVEGAEVLIPLYH